MQIERQFHYPGQEQFCSALGFLIQSSGGISFMFTFGITVFSMYIVYCKLQGDPFQRVTSSKRLQITLEILFVLAAVIIPLTYISLDSFYTRELWPGWTILLDKKH